MKSRILFLVVVSVALLISISLGLSTSVLYIRKMHLEIEAYQQQVIALQSEELSLLQSKLTSPQDQETFKSIQDRFQVLQDKKEDDLQEDDPREDAPREKIPEEKLPSENNLLKSRKEDLSTVSKATRDIIYKIKYMIKKVDDVLEKTKHKESHLRHQEIKEQQMKLEALQEDIDHWMEPPPKKRVPKKPVKRKPARRRRTIKNWLKEQDKKAAPVKRSPELW